MNFLDVEGKNFLITGVANKKSVAYSVASKLLENGASILLSIQKEEQREKVSKLFPDCPIFICDVENESDVENLGAKIRKTEIQLSGLLHSIAFANFSNEHTPFHQTNLNDFQQATNICCFSLITLSNALKDSFTKEASVVTISISNTKAVSYGYLGPIKAALDHVVIYLAKSFSEFSNVRFNAVCAGPLKTSASSGIPGYVNNYLFAEKLTLRKEALKTPEVANTASFLLSPASRGINATGIVIDAGMSCNYFDSDVVNSTMR